MRVQTYSVPLSPSYALPVIFAALSAGSFVFATPRLTLGLGAGFLLCCVHALRTESVTALERLGVQLERRRRWSPLGSEALFIPLDRLENVLITESITGWTVHFNLVFLTRLENGDLALHVAFREARPRLDVIREAWQGCRAVLYDERADSPMTRDQSMTT